MDKSWTPYNPLVMARAPTIVVGAGVGGLAAAIELAARGERVVVLERDVRPGGKARTVEVDGRRIDVGPTVLTMRWVFDDLFARAGRRLDDAVTLTPSAIVARHAFADGTRLDLHSEVDRAAGAIARLAGSPQADAYRRFAEHGARIFEAVRGPFLEQEKPSFAALAKAGSRLGLRGLASIDAHRTMWGALSSTFEDERLRALFGRYATYVGSSPFEAPATLNLIAHVEREGVAVVKGGMAHLAAALADLAGSMGVTFRYATAVRDVLLTNGRASGVLVEGQDGGREVLAAAAVIANVDVATLASGALGAAARTACRAPDAQRRSLSAVTWAIVGRAAGFPLVHHNVFFSRDYAAEHRALFGRRELAAEPTVYVCAQDRSADDAPPPGGDERLFVIVNAPATADVSPLDSAAVERCEQGMLATLARAGLHVTPRAMVRATPTLFERLAPGTGGALYGEAAHGPFSALARPSARTKVPGLFLAGGSTHPGPGVPMAALSGRTAARTVLADLAATGRACSPSTVGSTSTG